MFALTRKYYADVPKNDSSVLLSACCTAVHHRIVENKHRKPTGERRLSGRFPIHQEVRYRILEGNKESDIGCGTTVNISSAGILFQTEDPPRAGKRLELSVDWPARLDGTCRLKLVAMGRVVRTSENRAAMAIDQYEFRTQGVNCFQAAVAAAGRPS